MEGEVCVIIVGVGEVIIVYVYLRGMYVIGGYFMRM